MWGRSLGDALVSLSLKVNYQGEVDMSVDLNNAITRLVDPDPTKPVFLTGLRLAAVDNLRSTLPMTFASLWNQWMNQGVILKQNQRDLSNMLAHCQIINCYLEGE